MKKFEDGDIFVNSIKTHPKVKLFGYSGSIYINNTSETSIKLNDFLPEPPSPPEPPPAPEPLSFSADPPSLSFASSGIEVDVTITATGTGTESFTATSNNPNFFVYPSSGTITGGSTTDIGITFNGSDSFQVGQVTFSGETNSVVINVDSFLYSGGGPLPPSFP